MGAREFCQLLLSTQELDANRLRNEIAKLRAKDLASGDPLSLYHVAAVAGRPAAVRALVAAGLPVTCSDEVSNVNPTVCALIDARHPKMWVPEGGTALTLAARLGQVETVRALLEAGADLNARSPGTLAAAACPHPAAHPAAMTNIVSQLIAAGADVLAATNAPQQLVEAGCTVAAHLVLAHIFARSAAPQLAPPQGAAAYAESRLVLSRLAGSAAALDDVAAFVRFTTLSLRGLPPPSPNIDAQEGEEAALQAEQENQQELLYLPLREAVLAGSTRVLRLALQAAAAAPSAAHGVQDARWPAPMAAAEAAAAWPQLCVCVSASLPLLFRDAVRQGCIPALRLLLSSGCSPSIGLLRVAVKERQPEALRLLLAAGRPPVPLNVCSEAGYTSWGLPELPSGPHQNWWYTCPLLAALQARVGQSRWLWWQDEDPAKGPTRKDAQLLPLVEALVEAGYRPAVYEQVEVLRFSQKEDEYGPEDEDEPVDEEGPEDEECLSRLCERFDPAAEDEGLDLAGMNRWLWMAIQRPPWSPGEHHRFPPSFKAATRALLLSAHRLSRERGSWAAGGRRAGMSCPADLLAALPHDMVLQALGQAAYPLSAWA